jgi:hypothetical protein
MYDLVPIAGMVFSLLLALIVGGFVLMYPLTKRLGKLIELRLEERRSERGGGAAGGDVEALRRVVEGLQAEVAALAERQEFTERLLESGGSRSGEPGGRGSEVRGEPRSSSG